MTIDPFNWLPFRATTSVPSPSPKKTNPLPPDLTVLKVFDFLASDEGAKELGGLIKLASVIYPPIGALAVFVPEVQKLAKKAHNSLVEGLIDGSLVVSTDGGVPSIVPATNSTFDPKTGRFTTGFFHG